ncbi:MAG: hypothetical protein C0487_09590 [Leptothrix sp. (in: Bacteria)]|nr:hypothetical protein [Leptothrix sp. (in: b-proteobacteria)]
MSTTFKDKKSANTVHAVNGLDNKPWPTTIAPMSDARRLEHGGGFAPTRLGNLVKPFTTGEAYFSTVADAIARAKKSVFIAGWQINWDTELKAGTRLIDALKTALDNNPAVKIYVMPWMSPKVGLNTGDLGTMLAVFQLNAGRPAMRAFCCPAGLQNDFDGVENTFFSHHQKQVVIDNELAFVGGLDLAYGRRDDASFSLQHGWRKGPEIYSSCVPPQQALAPGELTKYVSEADLLTTTLSAGWLADTAQAGKSTSQWAADTPIGKLADGAWRWWNEPMPEWLTKPINDITRPLKPIIAEAQQAAMAQVVAKLRNGSLTTQDVTAVTSKVAAVMKATYVALLGLSWAARKANAELLTPGSQAAPLSGAILREDQPRQPWQDVHCSVEGPATYDLAMNFVRRWNSLQHSYLPAGLRNRVSIPAGLIPKEPAYNAKGPGTASVRVLRSAPLQLQKQEKAAMPQLPAPTAEQTDIHDMMVAVIRGAEQFVYIENQFFQSAFGAPSVETAGATGLQARSAAVNHLMSQAGTSIKAALTMVGNNPQGDKLPDNLICKALGDRIEQAIRWGFPFHVYIVLPVHPEGQLNDIAIVGQIHWTMQSLVYGSHSLVNRVRCALAAKLACKNHINQMQWNQAIEAARQGQAGKPNSRPYEQISPDQWAPYLTLLNLRNCEVVGGQLRTEQVYVHSKLLIADDSIVIMGSANINDRSLKGQRDSELAVYIQDKTIVKAPLNGKDTEVMKFGHELRKALWRKHLALTSGGNGVVKPASALAGIIDKPSAPETISAIQALAGSNQALYEKTFGFVPRSVQAGGPDKVPASIWPLVNRDPKKPDESIEVYARHMPFSDKFWEAKSEPAKPVGILGFFTALPFTWTDGENNHPDMNKLLLTQVVEPGEGRTIAFSDASRQNGVQS